MKTKIASLIIVLGVASISCADIAFNTFGSGDSYNTTNGWTIGGVNGQVGLVWQGDQFEAAAGGQLVSVTVAEQYVSGTNSLSLSLYDDDGANGVGSLITTWTFAGPNFGSGDPPTVLINGFPSISLTSGDRYWIIASCADDAWAAFNKNDQGLMASHTISTDGGATWNYTDEEASAFRVEVQSVPEPGSMVALGLGALALVRRRKAR